MKEPVDILRRGEENGDGEREVAGEETIDQATVVPRTSSERDERGEVIIDGLLVAFPRGTQITAVDQVRARGTVWDIEGAIGDYGRKIIVNLKRVGTSSGS